MCRSDGLALRAALTEGEGKSICTFAVSGEAREIDRDEAIDWVDGRDAKQKALSLRTAPAIELPDAGDFDADQPFRDERLGQARPPQSDRRDRRPHGRRKPTIAAGISGSKATRSARTSSTSGRTTP